MPGLFYVAIDCVLSTLFKCLSRLAQKVSGRRFRRRAVTEKVSLNLGVP